MTTGPVDWATCEYPRHDVLSQPLPVVRSAQPTLRNPGGIFQKFRMLWPLGMRSEGPWKRMASKPHPCGFLWASMTSFPWSPASFSGSPSFEPPGRWAERERTLWGFRRFCQSHPDLLSLYPGGSGGWRAWARRSQLMASTSICTSKSL